MVKNYMEIVVDNLLPTVLVEYKELCKCPRCIEDIKAMSLNQLKPLYVATDEGNVYAKLNEFRLQFKTDVISALMKSIDVVSKSPRHG